MSAAVVVDDLSKRYTLGSGGGYRRLTEVLADRMRRSPGSAPSTDLWALKDVSFEVLEGEVVGIIGRNGAGKSTLLKILSRITEPTSGRATLRGRVGSLLEVGTGFHPELTGRENVFLNGAVLGMRKSHITARFDEIVAFAEVERFLDTPVKRYSSGMYVRLAFAVAAHLEPDILVVDEVLAVGDTAFQKKCLGKMGDVAKSGRTILFVSHNMAAVRSLCSRGVALDRGAVSFVGTADAAVERYLANDTATTSTDLGSRTDRVGGDQFRFGKLSCQVNGANAPALTTGEPGSIVLEFASSVVSSAARFSIGVSTTDGSQILLLDSQLAGVQMAIAPPGGVLRCEIERVALMPGTYSLDIFAEGATGVLDWLSSAGDLKVAEGDFFGSGRLPPSGYGSVLMAHSWSMDDAR